MTFLFKSAFDLLLLATAIATVKCSTVYNYTTEVCCNGNRYSIPTDSYTCCGDQIITDQLKFTCCENTVCQVPDNVYWTCCDNELIDTTTSACANGKIIALSDEAKSANKNYACVSSTNITFYDYSEQTCCNGILSDKPGYSSICCGEQAYDYQSSLCCYRNETPFVVEIGNSQSYQYGCCGDTYYNYESQLCYEGTVIEKGNLTYAWSCGKQVYDYTTSICCDGVLHENNGDFGMICCGKDAYNNFNENKTCCNKTLYDNEGNTLCCNNELYDSTIQSCCFGEKKLGEGYSFYFLPLNGQIQNSSMPLECCGENLYNPEQQVCCNGELRGNPEGKKWGYCCGNEIIFDYQMACCQDKTYLIGNQTCCNDVVYDLKENSGICQVNGGCFVYNPESQRCCNEGVVDLSPEDMAAGRSLCCTKYY